ncbi:hypothetical protein FA13DRAFT_1459986 [Coprinellus micaceus]|uniref:Uncharacterized protein n=1 Tax=Coprinellus micaceus TaxID=71717 RepID=A0A4Y7SN08_COPMI|nr:hypothetical protein FA13DRAFT_1459986 [Coprinellus micaceus]
MYSMDLQTSEYHWTGSFPIKHSRPNPESLSIQSQAVELCRPSARRPPQFPSVISLRILFHHRSRGKSHYPLFASPWTALILIWLNLDMCGRGDERERFGGSDWWEFVREVIPQVGRLNRGYSF